MVAVTSTNPYRSTWGPGDENKTLAGFARQIIGGATRHAIIADFKVRSINSLLGLS